MKFESALIFQRAYKVRLIAPHLTLLPLLPFPSFFPTIIPSLFLPLPPPLDSSIEIDLSQQRVTSNYILAAEKLVGHA